MADVVIDGWEVLPNYNFQMNSLRLRLTKGGDSFTACLGTDANVLMDRVFPDRHDKWKRIIAVATAKRQNNEAEVELHKNDIKLASEFDKLA